MPWPKFTWDARSRQYKDARGKFVPRRAVRQALDEAIEQAKQGIADVSRNLQSGTVNLPQWQITMEQQLKAIHVMSAAAAAGGWAQATPKDWAAAGRRLQQQYKFLENFAYQIEQGLPLDGRFLNRAQSYATAGSGTYEKVLRQKDLASSVVLAERRRLHSANPCTPCLGYHALGWQPPETLPDIGESCDCHSRCQCTFERKLLPLSALKFKPSERAESGDYETVWVDVKRLDTAFQRDKGFAIGPGGKGAVGGRIPAFKAWLRKFVPQGARIEQPQITVDDDGGVSFTEGRHRFAVLRDLGLVRIPVSVATSLVDRVRRLFGRGKPPGAGGLGDAGPASSGMAARPF